MQLLEQEKKRKKKNESEYYFFVAIVVPVFKHDHPSFGIVRILARGL